MTAPLVSVIVPAKDQALHIADCLTSLTRQVTDPGALEVIMIDDGSTDATAQIAASFTDRLPRLTVLHNPEPVGLASARNLGLDQASGRYLAFLDGDDWLAPGHLGQLCRELARLDVDFLRTDHVRSTNGRREVHRAPQAVRGVPLDPRESILPDSTTTMVDYCYAWAGIFHSRISSLLRFPAGLFTAEDRAWCWRLHLAAGSYAVVDSPGILYRRGVTSSLTQIVDHRQLHFLPAFDLVFDLVDADRDHERFWPKAARMFLAVLAHHLGRRSLMTPGDAQTLMTDARPRLLRIPSPVLAATFVGLRRERRAQLRPLMESVLTRDAA